MDLIVNGWYLSKENNLFKYLGADGEMNYVFEQWSGRSRNNPGIKIGNVVLEGYRIAPLIPIYD